jgi:hypothetical protein
MSSTMRLPRISVVMPVLTAGSDLVAAVKSVLEPSFNHFELIVIDGSIDQSASLLFSFAQSASVDRSSNDRRRKIAPLAAIGQAIDRTSQGGLEVACLRDRR